MKSILFSGLVGILSGCDATWGVVGDPLKNPPKDTAYTQETGTTDTVDSGYETGYTDTHDTTETGTQTPVEKTIPIDTRVDALLVEETPTANYDAYYLSVGATQHGGKRSIFYFDLSSLYGEDVVSALFTIKTLSGTCHDSSDNEDCGYELPVSIYEVLESWSVFSVNWESPLPTPEKAAATFIIQQAYNTTNTYNADVTSLIQRIAAGEAQNHGMLLRTDDAHEDAGLEQISVSLGSSNPPTGKAYPAILNVTYYER